MVAKRAVRKQQDTSQPPARTAPGPLARLAPIADDFGAAAAQCVEDAESDAVHLVRTNSRRIQAMVEAMLREAPGTVCQQLEPPARAMLRPLKQIRRAAGPVRDLDVHRKLLKNWLGEEKPKADEGKDSLAHDAKVLRAQAEKLDSWLKSKRKHMARGMQKKIKKQLKELPHLRSTLWAAIAENAAGTHETPRGADAVALEDFVRATDAMPVLDAENLHDFRKATKKARYVAESEAENPSNSGVAKALKTVQDAIGEWHDWLCLAEEAETALGEDAQDLRAALEGEVDGHFAAAMHTVHSMRGRLIGEWRSMNRPSRKRPPATVVIESARTASGA